MIGNVNVPGALAADIATVSSVANEALTKANQALGNNGSNKELNIELTDTKIYPPNGFVNMEYKNGYYLVASGLYLYWTEDFTEWNRSQISTNSNYEANKVYLEGDMIICCKVDINRPKYFKSTYISYVLGDVSDNMTWYYGSGHIGYVNNVYIQNPYNPYANYKIKQSTNGIDWNELNTSSIFTSTSDLLGKINNVWYGYVSNSTDGRYYLHIIADLINPISDIYYTSTQHSSPFEIISYNNNISMIYMYMIVGTGSKYLEYYCAGNKEYLKYAIKSGRHTYSTEFNKNSFDLIYFNNKYIWKTCYKIYQSSDLESSTSVTDLQVYMPSGMLCGDYSFYESVNMCLVNNKLFFIGDSRFPIMEYIEDTNNLLIPKMINKRSNESLLFDSEGNMLITNTMKYSTDTTMRQLKSSDTINWSDALSNEIYPINIGTEKISCSTSKNEYNSTADSSDYSIKDFNINNDKYKLVFYIPYETTAGSSQKLRMELYKNGTSILNQTTYKFTYRDDSELTNGYQYINIAILDNNTYVQIKFDKSFNAYWGQYLIRINNSTGSASLINSPFQYDKSNVDNEGIFTYQFINTMTSWKNKLITIDRSGNVYSDNLLIAYVPIRDAFGMVPVLNNNYIIVYNNKQIFASSDDGYTWNNLKINLPENIAWIYSDHTHLYIIGESNTRYIYE